MREVLGELLGWWEAGEPVGVASVVATWRSAPRTPGAAMVVGPRGTAVGSVSAGCVESSVYELAGEVTESGVPVLARYGTEGPDAAGSPGDPFAVGLTCGGSLDVYVERVDRETFPELGDVAASVARGEPVAVVTCVSSAGEPGEPGEPGEQPGEPGELVDGDGATGAPAPGQGGGDRLGRRLVVWPDRTAGTLGARRLDRAAAQDVRGMLAQGTTGTLSYGKDGERRAGTLTLYVVSYAPRPRMLVFGASDFAAAVARMGGFLGYHVTVCDARAAFTTPERFPGADEVVVQWPHRYLGAEAAAGRIDSRTAICVLTHDPKFDIPLLEAALATPVGYVGAMGSRLTQADRVRRLREAGVPEDRIARLSGPIGLDIGARTPEETAVSIAAEITSARWGGSGKPLSATRDSIHGAAGSGEDGPEESDSAGPGDAPEEPDSTGPDAAGPGGDAPEQPAAAEAQSSLSGGAFSRPVR